MVTERARYRVTGGVFLVALAFIVLPMLFDGRGLRQPAPALFEDEVLTQMPLRQPELPATDSGLRRPDQPLADRTLAQDAQRLRESVDEEVIHAPSQTRLGDPRLEAPRQDDTAVAAPAWAVQLASFSDPDNAQALRDRLRADGHQALLSQGRQGSTLITRVVVGPILDRDDAIRLQQALAARYRLSPIVVEFSP